jgi:hypothetical protein
MPPWNIVNATYPADPFRIGNTVFTIVKLAGKAAKHFLRPIYCIIKKSYLWYLLSSKLSSPDKTIGYGSNNKQSAVAVTVNWQQPFSVAPPSRRPQPAQTHPAICGLKLLQYTRPHPGGPACPARSAICSLRFLQNTWRHIQNLITSRGENFSSHWSLLGPFLYNTWH